MKQFLDIFRHAKIERSHHLDVCNKGSPSGRRQMILDRKQNLRKERKNPGTATTNVSM